MGSPWRSFIGLYAWEWWEKVWKWQPDLFTEWPGVSPGTLPKSQNTIWFCRATWRHVLSLCMKIPLVDISKLGWHRSLPWRSPGATTEITKLWFATCLGSIIPLLQCNRGKTLVIPATRADKGKKHPEIPGALRELTNAPKIYGSRVWLVGKMEIETHLHSSLGTQQHFWVWALHDMLPIREICPHTKTSGLLMDDENWELKTTTLTLNFNSWNISIGVYCTLT